MPSTGSVTSPSTARGVPNAYRYTEPMHSPWYGFAESASHHTQNPSGPSESLNAPVLLKITCSELFAPDTLGTTTSAAHTADARTTRSEKRPSILILRPPSAEAERRPARRPALD